MAQKDIELNFPDLKVGSIDYLGEGMDSRAFEVNGTLIFRFPKNTKCRRATKGGG